MTTDQPRTTKAFDGAMRYLGWGDPGKGLWFVGLEESDFWAEARKYEALPEWEAATSQRDFTELKAKGRRIRQVTARIASWVSRSAPGAGDAGWRPYLQDRLWTPGSLVCQANLYPLGKSSLVDWPDEFEGLFGLGATQRDWYLKRVREKRFPAIRASWRGTRPLATICFGKAGWEDFRKLFELTGKPETLADGKVQVFRREMVILTPFFTRAMTNEAADSVGKWLRKEGVRIP